MHFSVSPSCLFSMSVTILMRREANIWCCLLRDCRKPLQTLFPNAKHQPKISTLNLVLQFAAFCQEHFFANLTKWVYFHECENYCRRLKQSDVVKACCLWWILLCCPRRSITCDFHSWIIYQGTAHKYSTWGLIASRGCCDSKNSHYRFFILNLK